MEIKCFKLVSGEDIVAEICPQPDPTVIWAVKPLMIGLTERGYAMLPFMPFAEPGTMVIRKDSLSVQPIPAAKKTEDAYISQTSGIELVPAGAMPRGGGSRGGSGIALQ